MAEAIAQLFEALDARLPGRLRVAIGECWDNRHSADGHFEIFIRLGLGYAFDGVKTLVDLVGPSFAKETLFTARHLYSAGPRRPAWPTKSWRLTILRPRCGATRK